MKKCHHFYLLPQEHFWELTVIGVCKFCGHPKKHLTLRGLADMLERKHNKKYRRGEVRV